MNNFPATPNCQKTLDLAVEISREMCHEYVSNRHLFLALMKEVGPVGDLFKNGGIKYESIKNILFPPETSPMVLKEFTD